MKEKEKVSYGDDRVAEGRPPLILSEYVVSKILVKTEVFMTLSTVYFIVLVRRYLGGVEQMEGGPVCNVSIFIFFLSHHLSGLHPAIHKPSSFYKNNNHCNPS